MPYTTAKLYLQQLQQNAHVCKSVAQLMQQAVNKSDEYADVVFTIAQTYIMADSNDTASVLYVDNIEQHLDTVLFIYNTAQQLDNLHEMLYIEEAILDNKRVDEFFNAHNIECEVL